MAQHPKPLPPDPQRDAGRPDARRQRPPGEDPGTLTDEEYLSAGGPDALDAAADERTDTGIAAPAESHSDSPPRARPRRDDSGHGEDPERPRSGSSP